VGSPSKSGSNDLSAVCSRASRFDLMFLPYPIHLPGIPENPPAKGSEQKTTNHEQGQRCTQGGKDQYDRRVESRLEIILRNGRFKATHR
jgi:hypothetical protein